MSYTAEQLYQLLPAFYRVQDAEQGEPLKALLEVIAEQVGVIDKDISRLFQNWFIETCDEWVVPYIGDLLGVKGLHPVSKATYSLRAYVANTLRYRRRKGTATMLEQLARDITGWPARAAEFFKLLETTQYINHIRLDNHRTPDLRKVNSLELLDTPFDTIAHTVDVRHIKSCRGKHNIPNIGIFLWRLQAFPANWAPALDHGNGKFSFSQLGNDIPLFNPPKTETEITHLAEEINVPGLLRRLPLYQELEARREALVDNLTRKYNYFGPDDSQEVTYPSVFKIIYLDNNLHPVTVPADEILICNLEDWHLPPSTKTYKNTDGNNVDRTITAAVDPVLGRLTFADHTVSQVQVSYTYGFSSEVGGGCYQRDSEPIPGGFQIYEIGENSSMSQTIQDALVSWEQDGSNNAVLLITDSRTYEESINIVIPAGIVLEIRAADEQYPLLKLTNPFTIMGETAAADKSKAKLILDGLRISGERLEISDGDLGYLKIRHCTLVPGLSLNPDSSPVSPGQVSLFTDSGNTDLKVTIERSICGGIQLLDTHDLEIRESIIQGLKPPGEKPIAIEGPQQRVGPNLVVESSTIMGEVSARMIQLAANSIFTGIVKAELTQMGCVRFCYIPLDSQVPRRYRCQPNLAIKKEIEAAEKIQSPLPDTEKDKIEESILAWLKPVFTDPYYGMPGYAQLGLNCPKEIYEGAEDGSEMGVFQHLHQPQREANLRASLEEYLPANMEAGIFFVN